MTTLQDLTAPSDATSHGDTDHALAWAAGELRLERLLDSLRRKAEPFPAEVARA